MFTVYICRNAEEFSVYVGVSSRGITRLQDHRHKEWWGTIASIDLEHFDTAEKAANRESALIRELDPPMNKAIGGGFSKRERRRVDSERLCALMVERGLNGAELGRRSGLTRAYISLLCKGERTGQDGMIRVLAEALECDLDSISVIR